MPFRKEKKLASKATPLWQGSFDRRSVCSRTRKADLPALCRQPERELCPVADGPGLVGGARASSGRVTKDEPSKVQIVGRVKSLRDHIHSIGTAVEQRRQLGMIVELMRVAAVPNGDVESSAAMLAGRIEAYGDRRRQASIDSGDHGVGSTTISSLSRRKTVIAATGFVKGHSMGFIFTGTSLIAAALFGP
ncbi:MAG: hypothetical protein WCC90_17635 [Methylocella sp.]